MNIVSKLSDIVYNILTMFTTKLNLMDRETRTIKGFYSQQGYANLTGQSKSTVSMQCRLSELGDGPLDIFYTEDGKRLIKATPDQIEKAKK